VHDLEARIRARDVNLRNIRLPQADPPNRYAAVASVELKDIELEGVDFTGASLDDLWLEDAVIGGCVFDEVSWRRAHVMQCRFERCRFADADLREWAIGGRDTDDSRTSFNDCEFSATDLRGLHCNTGWFEDCRFVKSRLDGIHFGGSVFIECRFEGRINDAVFEHSVWNLPNLTPNPMIVDFSAATLVYTGFKNLLMDRVRWPEHKHQFVFDHWRTVISRTASHFSGDPRPTVRAAAGTLDLWYRWGHPEQETGCVHRTELGPEWEEIVAYMRDVEAQAG